MSLKTCFDVEFECDIYVRYYFWGCLSDDGQVLVLRYSVACTKMYILFECLYSLLCPCEMHVQLSDHFSCLKGHIICCAFDLPFITTHPSF